MSAKSLRPRASNENEFPKWRKTTMDLFKRVGISLVLGAIGVPLCLFLISELVSEYSFFASFLLNCFICFYVVFLPDLVRSVSEEAADGKNVGVEMFFFSFIVNITSFWRSKNERCYWYVSFVIALVFVLVYSSIVLNDDESKSFWRRLDSFSVFLFLATVFSEITVSVVSNLSLCVRKYQMSLDSISSLWDRAMKTNCSFQYFQRMCFLLCPLTLITILLDRMRFSSVLVLIAFFLLIVFQIFSTVVIRSVFESKDGIEEEVKVKEIVVSSSPNLGGV